SRFKNIYLLGAGKASGAMAEVLEEILGDRITEGFINVNLGNSAISRTGRIIFNKAGHPIPDEDGLRGSRKIIELASRADNDDLIVYLISGGGSALAPLPADGISLRDKMVVTGLLLKAGATINELNTVRKHLSAIKGGLLAKAASPATVIGLIISDVVGDPLDVISSGPTAHDPSTFKEAKEVLERYGLWEMAPRPVKSHIELGATGEKPETPKAEDKIFDKVYNIIVASSESALESMRRKALKLGLRPVVLSSMIEGESKDVGKVLASIAKEVKSFDAPVAKPAAIIGGGETTVTVKGSGSGGRNQELALGAALKISGYQGTTIASMGSDGIDGPTDAAGAVSDGTTLERAMKIGMEPYEYLRENNSYSFFMKLGDLIFTGPTGTNINDLMILIML
ncbi:MAG TPA: glycerate kinase, partial [Candidatus Bathyarchaeia archaeon]|nr:glycerate kinase [Candidatus Bathyarchaeia archaeon]